MSKSFIKSKNKCRPYDSQCILLRNFFGPFLYPVWTSKSSCIKVPSWLTGQARTNWEDKLNEKCRGQIPVREFLFRSKVFLTFANTFSKKCHMSKVVKNCCLKDNICFPDKFRIRYEEILLRFREGMSSS